MRRWQSGQLQVTVNHSASAYGGSNPSLRTRKKGDFGRFFSCAQEGESLYFVPPVLTLGLILDLTALVNSTKGTPSLSETVTIPPPSIFLPMMN